MIPQYANGVPLEVLKQEAIFNHIGSFSRYQYATEHRSIPAYGEAKDLAPYTYPSVLGVVTPLVNSRAGYKNEN